MAAWATGGRRSLQLESESSPNESITKHPGKGLDRWISAILDLAIVYSWLITFILHRDFHPTSAGLLQRAASPLKHKSSMGRCRRLLRKNKNQINNHN